jgi:23S rRNA (adenine2503-C2)-methyltransferase
MESKVDFFSNTPDELREIFLNYGESPFRGEQIFRWINKEGVGDYSLMTDISKSLRGKLSDELPLTLPLKTNEVLESEDGSFKFILETQDENPVEAVLIPGTGKDSRRYTLCVSTQSGCAMGCLFCETGLMGLLKNLTPGEIAYQVTVALNFMEKNKDRLQEDDSPREQWITNIVYMGMGEPFHNLNAVVKSIWILVNPKGLNFSQRRITVSTCGLADKFKEFGEVEGLKVNLAVSLNSADNARRTQLMPINEKFPLDLLMSAIRSFPLPKRQRITLEYIMFKGINDSEKEARDLAKMVKGLSVKINLIPYNPGSIAKKMGDKILSCSSETFINQFAEVLRNKKITVTIRKSFGKDIKAACGQLKRKPLNPASS